MIYTLIHIVLHLAIDVLGIRAFCRILNMKSTKVYVALSLLGYICSAVCSERAPLFHYLVVFPYICLVPILCSQGRLSSRVARTCFMLASDMIPALVGSALFSVASGGMPFPQTMDGENMGVVVGIYALIIPTAAIVYELIALFFLRLDGGHVEFLEMPVVSLMICSLLFLWVVFFRAARTFTMSSGSAVMMLLYCILSTTIGIALLTFAQRDTLAKQSMAEHAAAARQIKHLRYQVETTTLRSLHVRRLRHDLANQVDVVHELVAEGRPSDADRYLATLQEQARRLAAYPQRKDASS